jgi:hypothetical protein
VRVRVAADQTLVAMEAIEEATEAMEWESEEEALAMEAPSEVEALVSVAESEAVFASVWPFTTAASEVVAPASDALVWAFTTAATDVEAVVISEAVARAPEVSPAPVRVRVALDHTSTASEPKEERVRDE